MSMKISNVMRSAGVMATLVASAVALAACGGGDGAATASEDSVASTVDLNGVKISVGSKEYPEQVILGQITVQALEGAGATVTDKTGLSGTNVARAALEKGEIDVYWEYTGTAWTTFFKETKIIDDPQQFFEAVRAADEKNDISWFALAPFNNTYAVGATAEAAEATGVTSISEYAELAATNPEDAMLCASSEFSTRDDGLPGLEKLYGFMLPREFVFPAESTVVYEAASKGECDFLNLVSTDSRIAKEGIVVLDDDKSFFPIYNPAVNMRSDVYAADKEQYDKLFGAISELLTQEKILELNSGVELDGLPAEVVAKDFLEESGIL
jgi:osmoprotectant transport system substrate-binding protein